MISLEDLSLALTPLVNLRFDAVKIGRRLKRVKKLVLQVGINRERLCVVQCFHSAKDTASYSEYIITGANVSCVQATAPRQSTPINRPSGYAQCLLLSGKDLISRKGRDTTAVYVFCREQTHAKMLRAGVTALSQAATRSGSCRLTALDATLILEASVVRSRRDEASSSTSGLSTRSAASFFQRKAPKGGSPAIAALGSSLLNRKTKKRWRGSIAGVIVEQEHEVDLGSVAAGFGHNGEEVTQDSRYQSDEAVWSIIRAACHTLRGVSSVQKGRLFARLGDDERRDLEALQKLYHGKQNSPPRLDATNVAVVSALLLYAFDRMPFGVFPAEDFTSYLKRIQALMADGIDPVSSDAARTALRSLCRQLPTNSLILLDTIGSLLEELCPGKLSWDTSAALFGPRLVYNLRDSCTQLEVFETPTLPVDYSGLRQVVTMLQSISRGENRAYLFEKAKVSREAISAQNGSAERAQDLSSSFGLARSSNDSKITVPEVNEAMRGLPTLLKERARVADDDVESRLHAVKQLIVSFKSRLETRPNAKNAPLWKREVSEYETEYAKLQKQLRDKDYDHGSLSHLEHINEVIRLWHSSKSLDPDRLLKRNQDSGSKDPRLALLESSELLQNVLGDLDQVQLRFGETPCRTSSAIAEMLRECIQCRLQLNDYHNELIMRTEEKALEFERRFKGPGAETNETESSSRGFQWQPTISYLWS